MTGKHVQVDYAHIRDIRDGQIVRHRQFIDTGKIERARHPDSCSGCALDRQHRTGSNAAAVSVAAKCSPIAP